MMKRNAGFTLVELMVTLVVAIVLISFAAPLLDSLRGGSQAVSTANTIVSAIKYARSEAVTRGVNVIFLPTSSWAGDIEVYVENDAIVSGTTPSRGSSDTLLRQWSDVSDFVSKSGSIDVLPSSTAYVGFEPSGIRTNSTQISITVTPSNCKGEDRRVITLYPVGQVEIAKAACS